MTWTTPRSQAATVSITGNFASGQDVLGFTNVPATMGNITGIYNAGTGVMTLTSAGATATLVQWQAALQSVTYSNSSDNPSVAARTVSYTVNDGAANSNIVTSTINVTAVNDAPTATNASAAETYIEDTALNLTDIVVSDVDSPNLTVTLTLSDVAAGSLNTATAGSVTSTFAGGVWTAAGAIADVNTLLAGLTFTPATDYNANFTIATSVSDGVAPALTGTKAITGTPVNDPPTVSAPATFTVTEDVAGNLVYTGTPFADVDNTSLTVTLSIADGTIDASTGGGVSVSGSPTARTFNGTVAALNTYFTTAGNISYLTALDNTTARTLTTLVSDGALSASTTSTVNVTSVNDAPVGTNNTVTTNEDTAYIFGTVDFGFTDPNDSPANSLLAVNITTLPTAGQF